MRKPINKFDQYLRSSIVTRILSFYPGQQLTMSSRILTRPINPVLARSSNAFRLNNPARCKATVAAVASPPAATTKGVWERPVAWVLAAGTFAAAASIGSSSSTNQQFLSSGTTTSLDGFATLALPPVPVGPVTVSTEDPATLESTKEVTKEVTITNSLTPTAC